MDGMGSVMEKQQQKRQRQGMLEVDGRTIGQHSGRSAVNGLQWLARTGPAPLEAWAVAMNWSRRISYRKAEQLEKDGWITRQKMAYGEGSLLTVTRLGVIRSGAQVTTPPLPAPTWWAHHSACAWVAAWLTARGRAMQGPREIDVDDTWRGEISWQDNRGRHGVHHRPDLAWVTESTRVAIEVELSRKSNARLAAIVSLHARWRADRNTAGVLYVCRDQAGCDRIIEAAAAHGLHAEGRGGLRVETLEEIITQARDTSSAVRTP
jgi:hypothetical protein